jgi:NADH dehydrogenase (ubiquinone) Fe-S protein 6
MHTPPVNKTLFHTHTHTHLTVRHTRPSSSFLRPPPQYKLGKHRSNAIDLVHKVPPIEVEGEMAVCDGGGGALGHPTEYISLARPGAVEYCKYCALRYTKKKA